ncbi:hypothetical protein PAMC26577_37060 [Caballeronia sordidicola]|jgi:hypothetical protein|uniref:Uncharacterized protein n=1 Tax=Caballeronia sordidicola TaxID=196367 RepID=A0A2C9XWV9_CABSO|nr:hypothetical protein PAMC26577_37060 [Caballeronia sordidicola]
MFNYLRCNNAEFVGVHFDAPRVGEIVDLHQGTGFLSP